MAESVARDVGHPQIAQRVAGACHNGSDTPRGIVSVTHVGLDEGLDLVNHEGVLGL